MCRIIHSAQIILIKYMQNARLPFLSQREKDAAFLIIFSYQPGCGQKKKATTFIVAFLCLRYVFPFKDYRKRFMPSVADSGSSLSETVKFTLCLEENASRATRNSSA